MRSLLTLILVCVLASVAFATADTLRVIRGGDLVKSSSPIVTDLTVEDDLSGVKATFSSYVTANNLVIPSGGTVRWNASNLATSLNNLVTIKLVTINISGTNHWLMLRTSK